MARRISDRTTRQVRCPLLGVDHDRLCFDRNSLDGHTSSPNLNRLPPQVVEAMKVAASLQGSSGRCRPVWIPPGFQHRGGWSRELEPDGQFGRRLPSMSLPDSRETPRMGRDDSSPPLSGASSIQTSRG